MEINEKEIEEAAEKAAQEGTAPDNSRILLAVGDLHGD